MAIRWVVASKWRVAIGVAVIGAAVVLIPLMGPFCNCNEWACYVMTWPACEFLP